MRAFLSVKTIKTKCVREGEQRVSLMVNRWLTVSFLCPSPQFQNNNNYMNMAEANGTLLAAGDVSIITLSVL